MTESVAHRDPVEKLAEQFMARLRRGERPSLSEYVAAHPELADEIRDLFPALELMEQVKPAGTEPHPPPLSPDAPPQTLGDYRILREVARGGMGIVYEAVQEALGRHVALKILPADGDPLRLLRFRREARSAARLHHTNVVPVFDVGSADGVHYYAMQFICGQGLDEVLQELRRLRSGVKSTEAPAVVLTTSLAEGLRRGEFPDGPTVQPRPAQPRASGLEASDVLSAAGSHYFRSVAGLGAQAADALAYAHGQGVVHRDVKPSNLLLDTKGTLWLTDFGLAKDDDGEDLTRTGDVVGTIRYLAPERFAGVSDPRSDVYALGATLYELLTLRPAFPEADRVQLIRQITHEEPPRPRAIDPTVPRDLETVVLKAMEKDPARRYRTAAEVAEDLRRFLTDRPILARRASWREQAWRWCRRNQAVATSLAVAFAFLVVGLALSSWQAFRATKAEKLAGHRLDKQVEANKEERRQLFKAKRAEAKASRYSRRPGQRFEGLEAITEAARLARELEMGDEVLAELRDDAIACLALPDVRRMKEWEGWPAGSTGEVGFDADLKHYARSDQLGNISVRRVEDDGQVALLKGDGPGGGQSGAAVIQFSPDGKLLAAHYWHRLTGGRTDFQVWDWRLERVVFQAPFPLRNGFFQFSPDGRRCVLGRGDGKVRLLETDGWKEVWCVEAGCPIRYVAFRPDGAEVALASTARKQIQVRRSDAGELDRTVETPRGCGVPVWCGDSHLVASGEKLAFYLYDAREKCDPVSFAGHLNSGLQASVAPGSGLLLSWSWDGTNRLWDPWGGRELLRFDGGGGWFSRDGRRVATQTGRQLNVWELAPGREYRTLPRWRGAGSLNGADVSPCGRWLALSLARGACLMDLALEREVAFFDVPGHVGARFHPAAEGRELFTVDQAGVRSWALRPKGDGLKLEPVRHWRVQGLGARPSMDARGQRLAVESNGFVRVIDLTGSSGELPPLQNRHATHACISPDGLWVASGTNNGFGIRVWDSHNGKLVREFCPEERSTWATFSPDGRWLVLATGDGYGVYRAGDWELERYIPRGRQTQTAIGAAFSPDGRVMAVKDTLSVIRLIDTRDWQTLARLHSPGEEAGHLIGFTPDGGALLCRTAEPTVRLWDLRLIREQLRAMGLDWNQPAYRPAPSEKARPTKVEFDGGWVRHHEDGQQHARAGRWQQAVASLSRALELESGYAQVWDDRGVAHARLGQSDRAIEDFTQAIELNPTEVSFRRHRADVYASKRSWKEAEADLAWLAERSSKPGESAYLLALVRLARGDEAGYRKVVAGLVARAEKDLSFDTTYYAAWLAVFCPASGVDPAVSLRLALRARESDFSQVDLIGTVGLALYRAGRYEEALKLLRVNEASAAARGNSGVLAHDRFIIAMILRRMGRGGEARKALAMGLEDQPRFRAAWNYVLTVELARREAEEVLKSAPEVKKQ